MNLYSAQGNWRKAFWPGISRFFLISAKSTRNRVLSPGKGGCPPGYPQSGPQSGRQPSQWGRTTGTAAGSVAPSPARRTSGSPEPGQAHEGDTRKGRIRKRGPSMYEMEGPRRGHLTGPPITRLPGCHPAAPPGQENQPGTPVSQLSVRPPRRSGFPVRWSAGAQLISILGGAEFLPLTPGWRKGFLP
jgi:hypothetical protein